MNPPALILARAAQRLAVRLQELERRLDAGDAAAWADYCAASAALAAVVPVLSPANGGQALTTREMAARLGVAPKTLRKAAAEGRVAAPIRMGRRGRGALRWTGGEATR